MSSMTQWARWGAVVGSGLVAGYAAVTVKGIGESVLQPWAEKIWPPTKAEKLLPGADPADHPEKMPPTVIVDRVFEKLTGDQPQDEVVERAAAVVHWGLGLSFALGYAVVRWRAPGVGTGWGAPAGLALYAATHGSLVPALQVQPPPWRMPTSAVAWEAGSHVMYGVTLDLALRAVDAMALHLPIRRR